MEEEKNEQNPPPSPSISSLTTDSETEMWEVIEHKEKKVDDEQEERNPKITIDKAESIRSFNEHLPSDDDKVVHEKDVSQSDIAESSLNVGKSSLFNR